MKEMTPAELSIAFAKQQGEIAMLKLAFIVLLRSYPGRRRVAPELRQDGEELIANTLASTFPDGYKDAAEAVLVRLLQETR